MSTVTIHSNWKASTPEGWTHVIDPHTLLLGRNGKGKSRVTEALKLALEGTVDGVAGRNGVKAVATLWRGAPEGADVLFVHVAINHDDGNQAVIRWESHLGKTGKPKAAVRTVDGETLTKNPGVALLVNDLRANLFSSPETAARWLAKVIGFDLDAVVKATKTKLRSSPVKAEAGVVLDALVATVGDPDDLLVKLKGRLSEAEAKAKSALETIDQMKELEGPPVTDDQIAKMEQLCAEASTAQEVATVQRDVATRLVGILDNYNQAKTERDQLVALHGDIQEFSDEQTQLLSSIVTALDNLFTLYPESNVCPCCQGEVGNAALKEVRGQVAGLLEKASGQGIVAVLGSRMAQLDAQGGALRKELSQETYDAIMAGTWKAAQAQAKIQEVDALRQEAYSTLDTLQRRRVASAMAAEGAQKLADDATATAEMLQIVVKAVSKAIMDVGQQSTKRLAKKATKYVPASFGEVQLTLKPSVQAGFLRGGKIGLASGAEEAVLLLALAAAIHEEQGDGGLAFLIAEDRAYDDDVSSVLCNAFGGLRKAGLFVVLSFVREVDDAKGAGWTIIEVAEEKVVEKVVEKESAPAEPATEEAKALPMFTQTQTPPDNGGSGPAVNPPETAVAPPEEALSPPAASVDPPEETTQDTPKAQEDPPAEAPTLADRLAQLKGM